MIAINIDGKIKTYSDYPETWKDAGGNTITPYQFADDLTHYEDGFRDLVVPTNLTANQKLGEIYYHTTNDVFTYRIVNKSPTEIEQETAAQREITRNAIREKHEKRTVENSIALNPTDAANYFYEWKAGTYQIDQIRRFGGKTWRNTVANNTNAPDKGGWIEVK